MPGVRVLRLIEYQFRDQDTADKHLTNMTHSLGPYGYDFVMRSSIIQSPMTTEETKALAGNLAVTEDNDGNNEDNSGS